MILKWCKKHKKLIKIEKYKILKNFSILIKSNLVSLNKIKNKLMIFLNLLTFLKILSTIIIKEIKIWKNG
jgi:hypothetical protein